MIDRRDFLVRSAGIALGSVATVRCAGQPVTPAPRPAADQAQGPESFDLEVTISGLCTFIPAPDTAPGPKTVHVLMVAPAEDPGNAGYDGLRHYPRLFYDAAHDAGTGGNLAPNAFWHVVPLERRVLDLSTLRAPQGTRGGTVEDIDGLLDLTKYTDPLPDPASLDVPHLSSRVTLPLAYDIECPEPRLKWAIRRDGDQDIVKERVAYEVVWKIKDVPGDQLSLPLSAFFDKMPGLRLAPLRPVKRGDGYVVRLFISNAVVRESGPPGAVPPTPPSTPDWKLPHFEAFRDLYEGRTVADPWPELAYQGPLGDQRGTPYTCLPSGGH